MPISRSLELVTPAIANAKAVAEKNEKRALSPKDSILSKLFGLGQIKREIAPLDKSVLGEVKSDHRGWVEEGQD